MIVTVGIDIGGSTTKVVGFNGEEILTPVQVCANDSITSLYGAFGKFLHVNKLEISDIKQVNLTGVGCGQIDQAIYGLPTYRIDEFTANGQGGEYFAKDIEEFMVVSMGTGTSYVGVKNGVPTHLGGIGIGGGTIVGLSKLMLNTSDINKIRELAAAGNVGNIDLRVGDVSKEPIPGLSDEVTASTFGKVSTGASSEDLAAGIVHMVVEDICQTAALIALRTSIKDIVLIGSLINFPDCKYVCGLIKTMFPSLNFIIHDNGAYGTAIGTALVDNSKLEYIAG